MQNTSSSNPPSSKECNAKKPFTFQSTTEDYEINYLQHKKRFSHKERLWENSLATYFLEEWIALLKAITTSKQQLFGRKKKSKKAPP